MLLTLQVKDAHLKPMTLADAESATAAADVESATDVAVDVETLDFVENSNASSVITVPCNSLPVCYVYQLHSL